MAINGTNTMKRLNKSTPKRKQVPSMSSESDSRPVVEQDSNRTYHKLSDSFHQEERGG